MVLSSVTSLLSQDQQVLNKNSTPKLSAFLMSHLASPHIQKWVCGGQGHDTSTFRRIASRKLIVFSQQTQLYYVWSKGNLP